MDRTRLSGAVGVAVAVAILASGCAAGDTASELPAAADLQLNPHGDPGLWFDDAYADGVADVYETSNTVCGIVGDVVVESETAPTGMTRVVAYGLADHAEKWSLSEVTCASGATDAETVLATPRPFGTAAAPWQLVDATTGETRESFVVDDHSGPAQRVGQIDGTTIVQLSDGQTLLGLGGEGIQWERSFAPRIETVMLDDGFIGVRHVLTDTITVHDGRTGEEVSSQSEVSLLDLEWASDGYIVRVNETDPEYAFFDLYGEEVDRTVGESQFGFFPSPERGLTFPLDDHLRAGTVTAVDADGVPAVLSSDTGHGAFLRGGKLDESRSDLLWPTAVSADGSLVLSTSGTEGLGVYDEHGELVFERPEAAQEVWVEAGYIVTTNSGTTQVLIPGS